MTSTRKAIPAATEAALWALSNGRCYAPGCSAPVVVEVRPGVYRKNAQIAHIRGVRRPRHDPSLSPAGAASFSNLLILCLPHHAEVDDRKTGESQYPVKTLVRWKTDHEGANGPALAKLGSIDEETLTELLTQTFSPPARRLERIADQLEETGTLTALTLRELRQVVEVMDSGPAEISAEAAEMLAYAAGIFGKNRFHDAVGELSTAANVLSSASMRHRISELHEVADILSSTANRIRRGIGGYE